MVNSPQSTSPLHRDEPEGEDDKGRLHGASAVQRLLNATEVGPDWNHGAPVNFWNAADAVVQQADEETKDAALRRLLALHMYDLTNKHPQVATRNLKEGDGVKLHGMNRQIVEKIGDGKAGRHVTVRTIAPGRPEVGVAVFANGGDVHVPLLHRVSPEKGRELFQAIANASQSGDSAYSGLFQAFLMMLGADEDELHEHIELELQLRHDRMIAEQELF